ncbi:glycosyltransferase family 2 protein [Sphingomonas parva]|uniref:Glycosyltransferase family 2 protein n=1 Tax=Sphingomonas parva TaxID=2555898 RepID=A0A4Y8ZN73_9SPHN|nr:glycosyltransferase family 2 protein [Sphingomonas parva]TFI57483.1 glycosyltransferase family 2 protein [Sphingomonas parva]
MKLIIQIPCFNEAGSLPETLLALPRQIAGIDTIEYLVIDDGSRDGTSEIARQWGVHHIVRHRTNRGLAAAYQSGIDAALAAGADIIVNTDADNQYDGRDIPDLVAPILEGRADIVIGDRQVRTNAHFGRGKQWLQALGSSVVQRLSRTEVTDAVSGFRAISRAAAQRIFITSRFSYTTEMLIQAGGKRMAVVSVPIRTNAPMRPSRLFRNIPHFILNTGVTMARAWAMYNPLRLFVMAGALAALAGLAPIVRFLYFFAVGEGGGHVQSLVLGGVLLMLGVISIMFGIVADLIGRNRQLLEATLERVRRIEAGLDAERGQAVAPAPLKRSA